MKNVFRAGMFGILGLAALGAGCSGSSSGGGGILSRPGGDIVITDGVTGAVLNTSQTNPYLVPGLNFTIDATEQHFAGPYTVNIISQKNVATASNGGTTYGFDFSKPCFTITQSTTFTSASVPIIFNGENANGQPGAYPDNGVPTPGPSGAPSTNSGNPCHSGEFEVAQISDSDGHTVNFYYEEYP